VVQVTLWHKEAAVVRLHQWLIGWACAIQKSRS